MGEREPECLCVLDSGDGALARKGTSDRACLIAGLTFLGDEVVCAIEEETGELVDEELWMLAYSGLCWMEH
jgi:hypothetical protein